MKPNERKYGLMGLIWGVLWPAISSLMITNQSDDKRLELPSNIKREIKGQLKDNIFISTVNLVMGIDQDIPSSGVHLPMILNLTQELVMVSNTTKTADMTEFSLPCTPALSCFSSNFTAPCMQYNCRRSHTLLRFVEQGLSSGYDKKDTSQGIGFSLLVGDKARGDEVVGILGLHKLSPFWKYLFEEYKTQKVTSSNEINQNRHQQVIVSIVYGVKNPHKMLFPNKVQLTDSFFTINGRYSSSKMVWAPFDFTHDKWVFPSAILDFHPVFSKRKANLCIDNGANHYLLFDRVTYQNLVKSYSQQLCGQPFGCTLSNSDTSNVRSLRVFLAQRERGGLDGSLKKASKTIKSLDSWESAPDNENITVILTPKELVNYDELGEVRFGFGDIRESDCANDKTIDFAVGRWFLTKVEFSIIADLKEGFSENEKPSAGIYSFRVGFSMHFPERENESPLFYLILLILILAGLGVLVVVCLNLVFKASLKREAKYNEMEED